MVNGHSYFSLFETAVFVSIIYPGMIQKRTGMKAWHAVLMLCLVLPSGIIILHCKLSMNSVHVKLFIETAAQVLWSVTTYIAVGLIT
jgi:hypothetical protein